MYVYMGCVCVCSGSWGENEDMSVGLSFLGFGVSGFFL